MAWFPDITVANIRAECAVIISSLRLDAAVTADIAAGKAFVESILRAEGYDTTNPAADLNIRDVTICLIIARELNSIYGSEQWSDDIAGAARGFASRVRMFISNDGELVGVPNLPRPVSTLTPEIVTPEAATEIWPYTTVSDDALK